MNSYLRQRTVQPILGHCSPMGQPFEPGVSRCHIALECVPPQRREFDVHLGTIPVDGFHPACVGRRHADRVRRDLPSAARAVAGVGRRWRRRGLDGGGCWLRAERDNDRHGPRASRRLVCVVLALQMRQDHGLPRAACTKKVRGSGRVLLLALRGGESA